MQNHFSHSRAACFRTCPRKHEIRYEMRLRPEETSYPMRFGRAYHAALEAIDKGLGVDAALAEHMPDPYDLAMVAALVHHHSLRYADQDLEVVAAELKFRLPLEDWELVGAIDRIVRLPGNRLAIKEYKTTSRDFAPGAPYWLQVHMDQQLSIYVLAARELGYDVQTILYDVTRRPSLRPLKKMAELKYKKDGQPYAGQRLEDETAEEFAARVSADIAERPDWYFAEIEIPRLDQDLDDCRAEIFQQLDAIKNARSAGLWYRNPAACINPYACEYLSICRNRDLATVTPRGFVRVESSDETATPGASPACSPGASPALIGE